jgi:Cu/Ag efflux protein CusF
MRFIRNVVVAVIATFAITLSGGVFADTELPQVIGEVKKVKPDSGKITIKHEPIPNLDMPGMTMVFRTQEGTDISEYRKGDKVTFTVVEKDGKMMIVSIAKAE